MHLVVEHHVALVASNARVVESERRSARQCPPNETRRQPTKVDGERQLGLERRCRRSDVVHAVQLAAVEDEDIPGSRRDLPAGHTIGVRSEHSISFEHTRNFGRKDV